jgi:PST family polysaccharide transporter
MMTEAGPEIGSGLEWNELGRRGARAALQLAARSLAMRALTFLGTLLLARLLVPEDFGVFGIVSFVVSLWAALGDFGLGAALVQQAEEPTPEQLATAWTAQQVFALAAVVLIWVAAPALAGTIAGLPGDAPWMLRVLALGLLLSSLRTLPSVMMERELRFGPLATAEVLQQIAYYSLAVALALAGYRAWSFVVAGIGQLAVGAVVVNLAWRRRPRLGLHRHVLSRLLGFGFDYQLSLLLMSMRDTPLPVLAGWVLGPISAGLIQFATRIALTVASIDDVVARIAFPAFSRLQGRRREQDRALEVATLLTALFVVPAQCALAALAPRLVPLLFGSQWADAVVPLQLLCIATLFRFPARYLRQTVFAEGASRLGLGIASACLIATIVPVVPGLLWFGLPGAGAGVLLGAAAGLAATAWLARPHVRLAWAPFLGLIAAGLTATVVALAGAFAAESLGPLTTSALTAGLFAITFGLLVWLRHRDLIELSLRLARRGTG